MFYKNFLIEKNSKILVLFMLSSETFVHYLLFHNCFWHDCNSDLIFLKKIVYNFNISIFNYLSFFLIKYNIFLS